MNFLYILLALVVLLLLITVHEFGHYVAGKVFGFKINEFSIGFGPKLYQRENKKTGELFSVRLLPLGGFCAFEGEDEENPSKDAFNNKAPWKRLFVLVSGVLFNFVFGIITAGIFLMINGYAVPCVAEFTPGVDYQNNPNSEILKKGDIITEINGKQIEIYRSMSDILKKVEAGETITVKVNRDGQIITLDNVQMFKAPAFFFVSNSSKLENAVYKKGEADELVLLSIDEVKEFVKETKPVLNEETGKYESFSHGEKLYKSDGTLYSDQDFASLAGITLSSGSKTIGIIYYNAQAHYGIFQSMLKAFPFCFYICGLILSALGGLFTGATAISEVGGTITAISQIAEISAIGFSQFMLLLPMLSMNLALFNILPIPALDGARCVFVLIEWIFKKPVPRKVENIIHTVGLFVLLGLVLFLDIYHFFIV